MSLTSLSSACRSVCSILVCVVCIGLSRAQDVVQSIPKEVFSWGGALRWRYEYNNRNGTFNGDRGAEDTASGFLRIRTRLWGQLKHDKWTAHLQLGNEFRHYLFRENLKGRRRFPDQLYIDQLWVRYEELFDFLDVKIGRQGLLDVGSQRLFSEGTPADGSRSNFFDAVRLTANFDDRKRQLEVIGLMIAHHDWLPTWGHQHLARGCVPGCSPYDYSGANHRELGLVLYWRDRSNEHFPWEVYAIWKQEEGAYSTAIARESKVAPRFNTYTGGFRLLPKFSDNVSGELEVALQTGDNHLFAAMAYGALSWKLPEWEGTPLLKAGLYGLTGDTDGTRGHHAWHALFNRSANLGDVVSSLYPNLDHNNILYPHLALSLLPAEATHAIDWEFGPLLAPARERDAYGHTGPMRGWLLRMTWNMHVDKLLDVPELKGLEFLVAGDFLYQGNYFPESGRDDLSSALLVEFRYTF